MLNVFLLLRFSQLACHKKITAAVAASGRMIHRNRLSGATPHSKDLYA